MPLFREKRDAPVAPVPERTGANGKGVSRVISLVLVGVALVFGGVSEVRAQEAPDRRPILGQEPQRVDDEYLPSPEDVTAEVWVDSLTVPWSLVFLPNGDALVAERPGRILRIPEGTDEPVPYVDVPEVVSHVDDGLMGMAVHPRFESEPYVYVFHTYDRNGRLVNRVVRLEHRTDTAEVDRTIYDGIPAARIHIGGRIEFGPDELLYIGTGDTANPRVAQDLDSELGKILRVTPEGEVPPDNPFENSAIYSYGHRVVQGLAWDPGTGAMFNSEHGPSGFPQEGSVGQRDEVNRVEKGGNYGWPEVVGAPGLTEYRDPIVMFKNHGVPPAGMSFFDGDLYVTSLGAQALLRIEFSDRETYTVSSIERLFAFEPRLGLYGRFRDVTVGPDGEYLYVTTSNTDGRARLRPRDDKILRLTIDR